MSRFSYSYDPKQFVLTIRGRFAESNQPLRLRFFFGPSDLLVRLPPKHWRVAGEGLANDDLVFYVGHAGLGENFRPENIASLGKRDLRRQRYDQLLGIFSCYSYTYNSQDWHKREVFLTGGSYGSSRSSLGILRYYDRVFASGRAPASIDYTEPGDFLILQSRR